MLRLVLIGIAIILTLYAVIECSLTPKDQMPGKLPKMLWLLIIFLLVPLGAIAWVALLRIDRAENGERAPKPTEIAREIASRASQQRQAPEPAQPQPLGPDDDPEYLARIERELTRRRLARQRDAEKEERYRKPHTEKETDPDDDSSEDPQPDETK